MGSFFGVVGAESVVANIVLSSIKRGRISIAADRSERDDGCY